MTIATRSRLVSVQTTSERGGAEYANVDLLRALAKRGNDVVLMTNVQEIAAGTGVRVRKIDLGPKLNRRSAVRVALEAPKTLLRLALGLRTEGPVGTLLLHFKKEQLLCSLLPSRLTGRIVWAEWGPVPPPLRRVPGRWLYALAAQRAQRIMAISEGTRRTVVGAGVARQKVDVVPNLIDVGAVGFEAQSRRRLRQDWGVDDDVLVIGCISRFQRRKRNDVAIDAMAHLSADSILVLAGEGEEEQSLRERAARHGERVRFVPNVRGQVEAFLSACDLFVFTPSPTEGAPRAIVMAQLVGVPVISTDAPGADELIPPGGGVIISPAHDPRALAVAITAYEDPERRRREGEVGRLAALERHDPERTLEMVEAILGL